MVIVAPHPDDEAIACSGTILRHIQSGDKVVVAIATDGRRSMAAATPDEVAAIRKAEATQAARQLGIKLLEWLGLPEGAWEARELEARLSEVLGRHKPTVIYAPSRIDFHPEHFAVAHALARALDSMAVAPGIEARVRVYQVQVPLTRILTNVVVDVSGVRAQSVAAYARMSRRPAPLKASTGAGATGLFRIGFSGPWRSSGNSRRTNTLSFIARPRASGLASLEA